MIGSIFRKPARFGPKTIAEEMTSSFGRNLGVTQLRTLKTSRGTERSMGSTQNGKSFAGWERKS